MALRVDDREGHYYHGIPFSGGALFSTARVYGVEASWKTVAVDTTQINVPCWYYKSFSGIIDCKIYQKELQDTGSLQPVATMPTEQKANINTTFSPRW